MQRQHHRSIILIVLLAAINTAHADWRDMLKNTTEKLGQGTATQGAVTTGLSQSEMDGGLKEALAVGVERAVTTLGKPGGFLNDPAVRIPLPGALEKTESALRMMGQGDKVDEFLNTVNRAAERAVPEASAIFGDAIRGMTIQDAQKILTGPDDSATRYFRSSTDERLTSAMLPIVRRATDSAGVTSAYKNMVGGAGMAGGLLGNNLDLDQYVTEKTLDGLFLKLAGEEKAIRSNPLARSSDLLKKVFGAVSH